LDTGAQQSGVTQELAKGKGFIFEGVEEYTAADGHKMNAVMVSGAIVQFDAKDTSGESVRIECKLNLAILHYNIIGFDQLSHFGLKLEVDRKNMKADLTLVE
jgi:hypothetical protein